MLTPTESWFSHLPFPSGARRSRSGWTDEDTGNQGFATQRQGTRHTNSVEINASQLFGLTRRGDCDISCRGLLGSTTSTITDAASTREGGDWSKPAPQRACMPSCLGCMTQRARPTGCEPQPTQLLSFRFLPRITSYGPAITCTAPYIHLTDGFHLKIPNATGKSQSKPYAKLCYFGGLPLIPRCVHPCGRVAVVAVVKVGMCCVLESSAAKCHDTTSGVELWLHAACRSVGIPNLGPGRGLRGWASRALWRPAAAVGTHFGYHPPAPTPKILPPRPSAAPSPKGLPTARCPAQAAQQGAAAARASEVDWSNRPQPWPGACVVEQPHAPFGSPAT